MLIAFHDLFRRLASHLFPHVATIRPTYRHVVPELRHTLSEQAQPEKLNRGQLDHSWHWVYRNSIRPAAAAAWCHAPPATFDEDDLSSAIACAFISRVMDADLWRRASAMSTTSVATEKASLFSHCLFSLALMKIIFAEKRKSGSGRFVYCAA